MRRGPLLQRGRGFGSAVSSIYRDVIPALKLFGNNVAKSAIGQSIGATLKKSAIQGVKRLASDAIAGKNIKRSLVSNLSRAKNDIEKTITEARPAAVIKRRQQPSQQVKRGTTIDKKSAAVVKKRNDRWRGRPLPVKKVYDSSAFRAPTKSTKQHNSTVDDVDDDDDDDNDN
jgi:hypothetical protein